MTSQHGSVPHSWVPVERRWLGLDRATIIPGVVVAVLAALMILVIPAIDSAVSGGEEVAAGDEVGLNGGVSFYPAAGWELTSGIKVGEETRSGGYAPSAAVTDGAISFSIATLKWDGTPAELLAQLKTQTDAQDGRDGLHITGRTVNIQSTSGDKGVLSEFRSTSADGAIGAYVIDGTGVSIVVTGPLEVSGDPSEEIAQMITSVQAGPKGADQ